MSRMKNLLVDRVGSEVQPRQQMGVDREQARLGKESQELRGTRAAGGSENSEMIVTFERCEVHML